MLLKRIGCHSNNRSRFQATICFGLTDGLGCFEAIHHGHLKVHKDQIELFTLKEVNRLLPVAIALSAMAMPAQAKPLNEPVLPDSGEPELPMGSWLGFHDVDPPLLAKLALHDKVRKLLIFVNRKGMELRRLEEEDYFNLIREGQVDIMEARNNFREQVERARARLQRHQS